MDVFLAEKVISRVQQAFFLTAFRVCDAARGTKVRQKAKGKSEVK
jgi:hypothetical protein